MTKEPVFRVIARKLEHIDSVLHRGHTEASGRSQDDIDYILANHMPSGSGVDCGTKLDESSTPQRLVFTDVELDWHDDGS
jgi:hypothetical protein